VIERRSRREIECIRQAGEIVAETLKLCGELAAPGRTTGELDREAEALIRKRGGVPLFKGYRGFPASICASVNDEVVHGIPGARELAEGDILSVDVGVRLGGYCADAAVTVAVGEVPAEASRLMEICRTALAKGIETLRPGVRLSVLSGAIQTYVEAQSCSVVRDYTGHGIGRELHEDPQIPNFVAKTIRDEVLPEGCVLAIEPMVTAGGPKVRRMANGWTVVTMDRSLSAHYEHTVAVTAEGPVVLTDGAP
jgi:methionyl aminopeptidase